MLVHLARLPFAPTAEDVRKLGGQTILPDSTTFANVVRDKIRLIAMGGGSAGNSGMPSSPGSSPATAVPAAIVCSGIVKHMRRLGYVRILDDEDKHMLNSLSNLPNAQPMTVAKALLTQYDS